MQATMKNDWYSLRYILLTIMLLSVLYVWVDTVTPEESIFDIAIHELYTAFIPVALFWIDERSKWGSFAAGLPGKRSVYIHSKYIVGLGASTFVAVVSVTTYIISVFINGNDEKNEKMPILLLGFAASIMISSVLLPVISRFGVRIAIVLFFVLLLVSGIIAGFMEGMIREGKAAAPDYILSMKVTVAALILYLISWLVSLWIYQNKEL